MQFAIKLHEMTSSGKEDRGEMVREPVENRVAPTCGNTYFGSNLLCMKSNSESRSVHTP